MIGEPLQRLLPIGARLEALIDEGKARLLAAPSTPYPKRGRSRVSFRGRNPGDST